MRNGDTNVDCSKLLMVTLLIRRTHHNGRYEQYRSKERNTKESAPQWNRMPRYRQGRPLKEKKKKLRLAHSAKAAVPTKSVRFGSVSRLFKLHMVHAQIDEGVKHKRGLWIFVLLWGDPFVQFRRIFFFLGVVATMR